MEKKVIKFLTTKQVAEILQCSPHHVGHLRAYGFLEGTRFAKNWLFSEDEVNRFIRESIGKDYWNFTKMTVDGAHQKYMG
jgi:excisionase family DNA binding protein